MVLLCVSINEVVTDDKKEKLFIYKLILDPSISENKSLKAAQLEIASSTRESGLEVGKYYEHSLLPFLPVKEGN